jgi:acyl-CoA synthetase (NDP forming)
MEMELMTYRPSCFFEKALRQGKCNLTEPEAKTVCFEYGISTPKFEVPTSTDEAIQCAAEIGYPVVMKIVSPQIVHKTEAGGVLINIEKADQAKDAFEKLIHNAKKYDANATILGVLIQKT